jgi:hypothetical protein
MRGRTMIVGLGTVTGFAGWILVAVLWAGFLALVLWAVSQLFPNRRWAGADRPTPAPGRPSCPPAEVERTPSAGSAGARR